MPEQTLYQVLEVGPGIDADGLRRAYRKLSKQNHPDLYKAEIIQPLEQRLSKIKNDLKRDTISPTEKTSLRKEQEELEAKLAPLLEEKKAQESKFKQISNAFAILSDKAKKAAYDRDEIDNEGNPARRASGYRPGPGSGFNASGTRSGFRTGAGTGGPDFEDFFRDFRNRAGHTDRNPFDDFIEELLRRSRERNPGPGERTRGNQRGHNPGGSSYRGEASGGFYDGGYGTGGYGNADGPSSDRSDSSFRSRSKKTSEEDTRKTQASAGIDKSTVSMGAIFTLIGSLFISHAQEREKKKRERNEEITWKDRAYKIAAWVGTGAVLAATLIMWGRSRTQKS